MDRRTKVLYAERAMGNIGQASARWRLLAGILALFVALGIYAYLYQVQHGHAVTGVSHTIFWGFYIVNFVFFIGISYGGAIISAILRLTGARWRAPITRIAEGTALVTLLVGAADVLVDVGRPDRMLNLILYAQIGSPITWDWIAINTYLVGTGIFFYLPLIPDLATCRDTYAESARGLRRWAYRVLSLGWQGAQQQERALARSVGIMAVLIIPLAVTVHSVLAWLFAVTDREGWHSTIFAPLFVMGAMLSGVGAVILVIVAARKAYRLEAFITERHIRNLSFVMLALNAAYIYFVLSEDITEGYAQTVASGGLLKSLFLGSYAPVFWAFVAFGLVLPLLLVALPGRHVIARTSTAAALVVGGMWLKRFLIVLLPGAATGLMPWEIYQVTWVEVAITLGSVAAIPLGIMIVFYFFPVMSIHELEEVEASTEPRPEPVPLVTPLRGGAR